MCVPRPAVGDPGVGLLVGGGAVDPECRHLVRQLLVLGHVHAVELERVSPEHRTRRRCPLRPFAVVVELPVGRGHTRAALIRRSQRDGRGPQILRHRVVARHRCCHVGRRRAERLDPVIRLVRHVQRAVGADAEPGDVQILARPHALRAPGPQQSSAGCVLVDETAPCVAHDDGAGGIDRKTAHGMARYGHRCARGAELVEHGDAAVSGIGHVQVVGRVDSQVRGGGELPDLASGTAEHPHQGSVGVEHEDPGPAGIRDVDMAAGVAGEAFRIHEGRAEVQRRQVGAIGRKALHSAVAALRDIDVLAGGIDSHNARGQELPGAGAARAPRQLEDAVRAEALDPIVSRVGHVDLSAGIGRNRAWLVQETFGAAVECPAVEEHTCRVEEMNALIVGVRDGNASGHRIDFHTGGVGEPRRPRSEGGEVGVVGVH